MATPAEEITGITSIPLDNQSAELPGQPGVRCSRLLKDGQLVSHLFENARTLYETFQRGKELSGDGPCLGWRPEKGSDYVWKSYGEIEARAVNLGSGLCHLGVKPGSTCNVGIFSANSVDWVVTEQSCNYYSRVLVPLYDTLGPEAVIHIINQAEIEVVLCHASKLEVLIKELSSCPTLRLVIKMGGALTEQDKGMAELIKMYSMEEVESMGQENKAPLVLPTPENIATICYTSGTTGKPKGVVLTHGNIIANLAGLYTDIESYGAPTPHDVHISYLPLAHMLERVVHCMIFMCGGKIGFYGGDIKQLVSDIQTLRPTLFVSVPRLLNRIYDRVVSQVSRSRIKKALFNRAVKSKTKEVQRGILRRNSIWDTLVFKRVQALLGGRVRLIFTGSAPIAPNVLDFLRAGFGCQVFEGYGQTECTSGCTATLPHDMSSGCVGPPLVSAFIKLVDVPDMNYFANEGEGEVCMKGPSVFQGYYKDEEKTREALDKDGWLHSGDIGKWMPNGTLKIIDRKKHIFKLAQGEYIAPEKVETVYCRSPLVAQAYLHGDSLQSACVAIIVPDEEELMAWARKHNVHGTFEELCQNEAVKQAIFDDISKYSKEAGLRSFEQAKVIRLESDPFTVENGLLTPTYKLRRPTFRRMFSESVNEMYDSITVNRRVQ